MAETDLKLTAAIVAAYVEGNRVEASELGALIHNVYASLTQLGQVNADTRSQNSKATAAQIRRSLGSDVLISFEDGKPYRMLRRHLTSLGITPAAYRQKWGLAADYPMTAPSYSAARSALAKKAGLGSRARVVKSKKPRSRK